MRLFRRRHRVDLGTYVDPPVVPLASVASVVGEGVMIATSGVRMALKNAVIVGALRDGSDFDPARLAEQAARQLGELADHEEASAERVRLHAQEKADAHEPVDDDDRRRYEEIHEGVASGLRGMTRQPEMLEALVARARDEALDELAATLAPISHGLWVRGGEPDYERERAERLRQLVSVDLAELFEENGGY